MKVNIEIILGFLEAGKTSFINHMIKSKEFQNETIVILQDEFGICGIDNTKVKNKIIPIKNDDFEEINIAFIKKIIDEFTPDRIFIEVNGIKNCDTIINIFHDEALKRLCRIDDIATIIDAKKFFVHFRNLKSILASHIFNGETIILNNLSNLSEHEALNIQKEITKINETANLIEHVPTLNIKELYQEEYRSINMNHSFFTFRFLVYMTILIFLFTFLTTLYISDLNIYKEYISKFKNFYTIFISILIQGIPFILIGSFISSVIQIYISKDTFIKFFPKNIFLSCIIAAFSGILFPICDCGTIPVVKGLIKKNVPIAAAITFMLAAPIVNPISIISTIYAFQGMKSVVICRILSGMIIAILVGLIMQFTTKKQSDILSNAPDDIVCDCGFCNNEDNYSKSKLDKLKALFIHTGDEFFNTGKFMIIGAFLASIFQTFVTINYNNYFTKDSINALIIMILLSFLLSVCSTSDAFIAKGFLKQFSINSIMGFLVVGPMLDIKNTTMLFGNFKKLFVLKLLFFILIISFSILITLKLA